MNTEQRLNQIKRLASLEELASMKKNTVDRSGLTEEIDRAFRHREFELFQEKTADRLQRRLDTLTPLELRVVRGLAALWMTHEKHLPPNRSIQALRNRDGDLIRFAEDVVSSGLESSGYRRLKAAGFDDLVFERVVLDHPEVFSPKARVNAQRRLQLLEDASVEQSIESDEPPLEEGTFSTKDLLETIGFRKLQPTAWYALRGDEIVFLSWVKKADFERGIARILADEADTRPNFYHWRSQIQKINAGDYRNAYVVFGYKGPDNANVQHSPELRLYSMREIQKIGFEVFATIIPVDFKGQSDADHNVASGSNEERSEPLERFTTAPVRPEQAAFRRALFERFEGRCALTGCAVAELLDAAHLPGQDWTLGHNTADDGILLRADLHRALDTGLIRLDENQNLAWVDPCVVGLYGGLIQSA
ncbi:HNH endonuclease signature motif containing protein [Paraburkholderia fungorum]|uniref:HNH endonuclease signature motif containing protein n=1 Tax=Paraburkholderia fungorum TaxID=134537 RepID=UPI001C1EDA45|nr:HNH endonuclease signature motif containing protein [Paraburkholderia fungorum]MBU7436188.1 HNH endonuclease [Paraburkholderia fungorum]